jgi:hypothetical protein
MFANAFDRTSALSSSFRIIAVAMMLVVSALYLTMDSSGAASCRAYVADSSYGNSNGFARSHSVASCSSAVSARLYATIVDAGGGWLASAAHSAYSSSFSASVRGYFCATLAPGYYFNYTGTGGHLYPLWTC